MKISMSRKKMLDLFQVLKTTNYDLPICGKFRYMVTSNIKIILDEIKQINEAFPNADGYAEYKTSESVIFKKYKTEPKAVNDLPDDTKQALEESLIQLKEKNKTVLDAQSAIEKERMVFLDETIELDLKTIKPDEAPDISENNQFYHWDIWNTLSLIVYE